MRPQLIIFIGLQASGKSSFYRDRFAATHIHISKDNFPNAAHRDRRQNRLITESLRRQDNVVVDNTNPSRDVRAGLVALAREYHAEVIGYYFESRLSTCLERNRCRSGRALVPDIALYSTINRLEAPSHEEGFEKLFYVHIVNEQFVVEDWREDVIEKQDSP